MKNFILRCLLLIYTFGYTHNFKNTNRTINATTQQIEKEPVLTTFIEGDQLYLTIPNKLLDKPMLFICYDIMKRSHMQVVWTLQKDKILLKQQSIKSTSGVIIPFTPGVNILENVLATFTVEEKYERQNSFCVNITNLILQQDIQWPQVWDGVYFGNSVPHLSMLLDTKNVDDEVIIKTQKGMVKSESKVAIPLYYSFCPLSDPMKGRRFDYRMGYWNETLQDLKFGITLDGNYNNIANINKWRLEKKYKDQELSVPIKPITFILSPDIPKKWRPYIKAGIEEWLPAFEAAGFKDAILVKEVDSLSEWQLNSIKNNIVYWGQMKYYRDPDNDEYGGTISKITDYRTGEILRSDIYLNASRRTLEENYFIRAAPLDKRTDKFPFPDELTGRLYQSLAAHETGHTFGIMDANYGENSYPVEKITDENWLETMGYTPSVMNYTRPNNIAQPEDNISPHLLIQKVGPADIYNIRWGYMEFPEDISFDEEDSALERIVRLQDSVPWYRFNVSKFEVIGPGRTNEVVESNDPVKSTTLALKNLRRVIELLPKVCDDQKDNTRLIRLYNKTLDLWFRHMRHVVSLIGGYDIQYKSINQPGNMYTPVPIESQVEALDFLFQNAFTPPDWLANPDFNSKIRYSVHPANLELYQQKLLIELLRFSRWKRLEYLNKTDGYDAIFSTFLDKLKSGIFKELLSGKGEVESQNQLLQIYYIKMMIRIITQENENFTISAKFAEYTDYFKGKVMEQLIGLKADIEKEVRKKNHSKSIGHWKLCLNRLNEIL